MSGIFKYAEYASGNADPAQEFLKKKISNTSYTDEQIERLENSGGSSVAGGVDDVELTSDFYNKQNPTKGNSDSSSGGDLDYSSMTGNSDTARNYREGNWGRGDLDAEALAEKFGLDRSNEGTGEGHIWGTNPDGSKVYIGKASDSLASNKDLIKAHSKQANPSESDHSSKGENLSSSGDIKGAILTYWKAENKKGGGGEKKEEPNKPIEYSPEIQQAINRVKSYEDDVMSGKISEEIYGGFSRDRDDSIDNETTDNVVDINDGQTGIGTEGSLANADGSFESTQNFLQSKKLDVLKKYQFKPVWLCL